MNNIILRDENIKSLKKCIGKTFHSYQCDPFIYSNSVLGIVGFYIEDDYFALHCNLEKYNRFFSTEEVSRLSFNECDKNSIISYKDGGQLINNPVEDEIVSIEIVNDSEHVKCNDKSESFYSTKGIIFHLKTGLEISFEVKTWFSEMITINRGYHLVEKFKPTDDFLEEWEDIPGYTAYAERSIEMLD